MGEVHYHPESVHLLYYCLKMIMIMAMIMSQESICNEKGQMNLIRESESRVFKKKNSIGHNMKKKDILVKGGSNQCPQLSFHWQQKVFLRWRSRSARPSKN